MRNSFNTFLAIFAAVIQEASGYHSFYDANTFNPNLNGILGSHSWYTPRSNYSALLNRFESVATHVIFAECVGEERGNANRFEFA